MHKVIFLAGRRTGSNWVTDVCCKHLHYAAITEPSNRLQSAGKPLTVQNIHTMYDQTFSQETRVPRYSYHTRNYPSKYGVVLKETYPLDKIIPAAECYPATTYVYLVRDFFLRVLSWRAYCKDRYLNLSEAKHDFDLPLIEL